VTLAKKTHGGLQQRKKPSSLIILLRVHLITASVGIFNVVTTCHHCVNGSVEQSAVLYKMADKIDNPAVKEDEGQS